MPTLPDGSTGWTIPPGLALSADGATTARGVAGVLRPEAGVTEALTMYDPVSREVIAQVTTSDLGTFPTVLTTQATAVWDFGTVQLPTVAVEATAAGTEALAVAVALQALVETLQGNQEGLVTTQQLQEALDALPTGPGGGDGTTTVEGITDATDFGRLWLLLNDAVSARQRIGAGTSSLELGTTSDKALPGTYRPDAAAISDSGPAGRQLVRASTPDDVETALGLVERIQDVVAAMLVAGSGATFAYDDAAGRLTLTVTGGGTGTGGTTDPEVVRDVIGAAMVAGAGIQVFYNDAADTLTITSLLRTVAGRAPDSNGNVTLSAGDLSSGTLALARMPAGHRTTVDYVRADGYSGANAWPAARPSSRTDVYFDFAGPADRFVVGQAPLSYLLDGDGVLRENA